MSSEISFNPDALMLKTGDLIIQFTTSQKLKYDIYLARPEGDFLSHLIDEIERIPEPKESKARTAHDKAEFVLVVLGVASSRAGYIPRKNPNRRARTQRPRAQNRFLLEKFGAIQGCNSLRRCPQHSTSRVNERC